MGVSVPPKLVLFMDVSVPHNFQVNQRTKTIFIKGNMLLKLSDNLFLFLTSCFSGSYLHFNLHSGAIGDCLVRRKEVAQHFLAIHNSSEQYKKWAKLSMKDNDRLFLNGTTEQLTSSGLHMKHKNQIPTDHTQDCVVQDVRRTLFETISSFEGDVRCEDEMEALIARQFTALQEAFHVSIESEEDDAHDKVAGKLLNLFRTGRLGHYILDNLPGYIQ